jgi:hypothetical protein
MSDLDTNYIEVQIGVGQIDVVFDGSFSPSEQAELCQQVRRFAEWHGNDPEEDDLTQLTVITGVDEIAMGCRVSYTVTRHQQRGPGSVRDAGHRPTKGRD